MNTMKVDSINQGRLLKVGNNAPFLETASTKLLMPPRNSKKTVTEVTLAHPTLPFGISLPVLEKPSWK